MSNLEECKASLIALLNATGIKYDLPEDGKVIIVISGDNVKGVKYIVSFDESGSTVNITGLDIASFGDKLAQGFVTVNRLNLEYRWIKFVIHGDGDLISLVDAVIEPGTAGEEIMQLIGRNVHILDEVYPEIMKEIWG